MHADRLPVHGRRIPFMLGDPVLRVLHIPMYAHAVARHFSHDGSRGDRLACCVTFDDS